MDVSSPISSVIPTLDGPVLGVLAGTTLPLTLTRVHRVAGQGSLSGVRRVLLRLVAAGLVTEVPGGYLLNREHVAASAIESLAQLWGECIARVKRKVQQWPEQPLLVGVFGSAARRDGDEESDIDLLLVLERACDGELSADLADAIRGWTGNPAHIVTLTRADLARIRRAREPVLAEWDRDLVVIHGQRDLLNGGI